MEEITSKTKRDDNFITMVSIVTDDIKILKDDFSIELNIINGKKSIKVKKGNEEVASWNGELESIKSFLNLGNLSILSEDKLKKAIDILSPVLQEYKQETQKISTKKVNEFSKKLHMITPPYIEDDSQKNTLTPKEITVSGKKGLKQFQCIKGDFTLNIDLMIRATIVEIKKDNETIAKWTDQREQSPLQCYTTPFNVKVFKNKEFDESIDVFDSVIEKCIKLAKDGNKSKNKNRLR